MGAGTIQQMADRVASLMDERLGIGGDGLKAKLKRGGRLLPHRVRVAAGKLADAAEMAKNPRLLMQVDEGALAEAYDLCVRHLGSINRRERRIGALVGFLASIAFGVLVLAGVVLAVLRWRGFL